MKRFYKFLMPLVAIVALALPVNVAAQSTCDYGIITVANSSVSNATTSYFPAYCYYNYSVSEVLVLASELEGLGGDIASMQFKPENTTSSNYYNNCQVYLGNSTLADLSAGWVQDTSLHLVFTGSLNFTTTDWQTITFDSTFYYTGDNLIVLIIRGHGTYASSGSFAAYNCGATRGRYAYRDASAIPFGSIPDGASNGTTTNIPLYKFTGCYAPVSCAHVSDVAAFNIDTSEVTISWIDTLNSGASYEIMNMADSMIMASGISDTSAIITGLAANTVYTFGVYANCGGGDMSTMQYVTFRTACGPIDTLPFIQNFNSCPTGSANIFDPCWSIYNTYSTTANYPYVTSGYLYMYLYASSGNIGQQYGYAILPPLSDNLTAVDMELSFDMWKSSSTGYNSGVIVALFDGTSTPANPVFDTIAIIVPTATTQAAATTYYVPIVDQDLTGKRIGFFYQNQDPTATSTYYYYTYIDNVNLHEAPTCLVPSNLQVNAANADSIYFNWSDSHDNTAWQLAYGHTGFNPDTVSSDNLISCYDSSYVLTEIPSGVSYEAYVRADCGSDQSFWIGPVTFTPGSINMGVTGSATMSVCNAVIYDDGGATGNYSDNCQYTLTLYPNDDTKRFKFWGSGNTESCCDYLRIYAGASASGTLLGSIAGTATIDTVTTQGGPITLVFHSDGSVQYAGFELHVACEDLPPCRDIDEVTVVEVSAASAYVTWVNAVGTTPLPNDYIVTVTDTAGTVVTTVTTSDMVAMVGGLDPNSDYTVTVVPACDESNGMPSFATFTTSGFGCLEVDTSLAFSDTIGNGSSTNNYLPSYSFYNYGLTQQIFTAAEIGHGGQIDNFSFMMQTVAQQRTYEIYMGHTSVSTASDFIHPADLTLVYNGGPVTMTANQWTTFNLTTPFNYNGTDNLVIILRDLTGSYVSGNYGYVHSASDGAGRYAYQDSGPYDPATYSGGYSLSVRNNIILGGAPCAVQATCAAPLMVVASKTENSVNLLWAAGSTETSWNVEHKAMDDATWTVDLANTTTTSLTITGLTPNTLYQFRVYHLCGVDTFATVRTVRTDCAGMAVPFFENFATWGTGSASPLPSACWFKGSNYSSGYPYVTTGNSMAGDNNSMYFYASGTTFTYLALPKFNAPIDTLVVSGLIKYSSSGYPLKVGVMTDPEDASTFQVVGGATTVANTWVPFEFSFIGMPEGNIAFGVGNDGSYAYLYLDNIEVNYYNPCVRPTGLLATGITTNSATLSWIDTAATNFEIEYGLAGFNHGDGTIITATGNTATLTGLLHSSLYDVYVRGICGAGDTSLWSFAYSFQTSCAPIDVLPLTENFNNWGTGTTVHAPGCWTSGSDYSTSYPYITTQGTHGGAMYMYDGYDAGSTNKTWFALPELSSSVAQINQTQVVFSVYSSTTSYEHPVMVGVGKNSTLDATVEWIDTIVPTYGVWTEHEVAFDSYTDTGRFVFFATHIGGAYSYSYPYVDDLTFEMIPTCQRPNQLAATNATPTSVDLMWNDRAGASLWQIEYGPEGFELGTGTTIIATSNPFTLTGLPVAFQGEFYVRAICSATDTGDYSRHPAGFATSQIPATLPYNYNFEDGAEWSNWQVSSNNPNVNWYRGSAVADSGSYSLYVSADSGATYKPYMHNATTNVAAYRDIDFGSIDSSYTLSFRARVGGTISNYYDGLMVFLVDPSLPTAASDNAITSPWGNVNDLYRIATVRLDTTWQTYEASFDTLSGIHRVAFFWFNQNTSQANLGEPAAVDNIHIKYSSCPRPVLLQAPVINSTNATLTWIGTSSADYEVVYREDGGTNMSTIAHTNAITLTGLTANATYHAWVRKLCGAGDTSLYSDGVTFTTTMCEGGTEALNYDPAASATTSSYSPIGYATYNYSYVQTIIDSAYLASLGGDITAFAFMPTNTTASDYYTNMTVYMANVSESDLSSGFILPDATHEFHKVIDSANFNFTTANEWQIHNLDSMFTWDGHSNLLFAVNREHGTWTSSTSFSAHTATASKMRYIYQDSGPYDYTTVSGGYTSTIVGDIRLISCNSAPCEAPVIMSTDTTETTITFSWAGEASSYEVAVVEGNTWVAPAEGTIVTDTFYTFTGLTGQTDYTIGVRAVCSNYSEWVYMPITTLRHPCAVPTGLVVTDNAYDGATVSWNAGENETEWALRVFCASPVYDHTYNVSNTPTFEVTGLDAGITYSVAVRALCDTNWFSVWSDTVALVTVTCPQVTNVGSSNITSTSATINWTSTGVDSYEIEYGGLGFPQGTGTTLTSATNSINLTGLEEETTYDVYVRSICAEGVFSGWSAVHTFQTATQGIDDVEGSNVTLFPNPASTMVTIRGIEGESTVTVVDLNGREVFKTTADNTLTIDLNGYAKGAYFVRITGERTTAIRKLIVK